MLAGKLYGLTQDFKVILTKNRYQHWQAMISIFRTIGQKQ